MKKRILVAGAPLGISGYSTHARVVLDALKPLEEFVDIHLLLYRFSNTSNTYEGPNTAWYQSLASKFDPNLVGSYDMALMVGVPPEWKRLGKINFGITAGVETLTMPPEWIEGCNIVDKIITVSSYPKKIMESANFDGKKITTPIEYIYFPVRDVLSKKEFEYDFKTKFNFLSINQWAPRKNLETMVHWFLQEFKEEKDIGLILKLSVHSNSTVDFHECRVRLHDILKNYPDRKCSVYLFHGDMTEEEINTLYSKCKAYVSIPCGESFALSTFDAVCCGMPVITTDYGGHKDYLYQDKIEKNGKTRLKPYFANVSYDINPVQHHHLMPGIIQPGMLWAYPKEKDFKNKIREVYKDYGRFKKQAEELKNIVLPKFSKDIIYKQYQDLVTNNIDINDNDVEIIEVD